MAIGSLEEAIELTNASPYGLLVGDLHRATSRAACGSPTRVRTGWVNINESSNYWESHLPFGGRSGTDSGDRAASAASHVMQQFTELQTVVLTP